MTGWQVAFRADASRRIGTGHVMRCLTLADELRERGAACVFVCRPHEGHVLDAVARRGHEALALPPPDDSASSAPGTAHQSWLGATQAQDADDTLRLLGGRNLDWLVVDHYALDATWEAQLASAAPHRLAIDDLADRPHDTDLLLDQNLGRTAADYDGRLPAHGTRLIGPRFGLLRPAFAQARPASLARRRGAAMRHWLLALGGVDADNATGRSLQALRHAPLAADTRLTVVMGAQAPWLAAVQAEAARMPWPTTVKVNVTDMAAEMAGADIAIGAAGTTAWERCCLGLPSINWVLAANQRPGAAALVAAACVEALPESPDLPADLLRALERISAPGRLTEMQHACASVVDGLGAARVADAMEAAHAR